MTTNHAEDANQPDGRSEREARIGMSPEEEQSFLNEAGAQGEPGDDGIGAETDARESGHRTDN